MKKNKILIFHPALAPYRIDFFNALNENFEAKFYFNTLNVLSQQFNQERLKSKCKFKCNYLLHGFELFGRSFKFGISAIIKKENPRIVLCSEFGPNTILVFFIYILNRKKFKLYTVSEDSLDIAISRKSLRSFIRNVISRNITGIMYTSKEVCFWHNNNISNEQKLIELPIIHSDELFRKELAKSINTANKNVELYNLEGKKVILFVGRLVKVKNLSFLIKVMQQLNSSDWALVIVGDGELMNVLKNETVKLKISNKVYFTGRLEGKELLSWYNIAQIFVLPSIYEPFGAVVNEALLGGCDVLCSEKAGASSLINTFNGQLFNPYNEINLLNHLSYSLNLLQPIPRSKLKLRKSKMPFTFSSKINKLIAALEE